MARESGSHKPSRRRASREIALQALYAWQLAGGDAAGQAAMLEGWPRCDQAFAEALIRGVLECRDALEARIAPHLTRSLASLSPVERVVLLIGAWELAERSDTPFKVVINEAIELGKSFGGTDGHKFVNGVLEKLAVELRADEIARARQATRHATGNPA
ncbi:MAG: transcription antitermination factor NusB [Betaproteobacteria bacterium]|nr:transcription antitermination factor NusB [Betaproteobacteria bacterium]